jgi:hypothetical protein
LDREAGPLFARLRADAWFEMDDVQMPLSWNHRKRRFKRE